MGQVILQNPVDYRNLIVNSLLLWSQPNQTQTQTCANATTQWTNFDMWFVKNALGTNGVVTTAFNSLNTNLNAIQAKITTAPTAAQANGCELYAFLDDLAVQDMQFSSYPGSNLFAFGAYVRALGNVTQIGVQPFYSTTNNTKPDSAQTSAAAEQVFTVSSAAGGTFISGVFDMSTGLNILTSNAHLIGLRFRILTVSSGNTYDLNNGFMVHRPQMNVGSVLAQFVPAGSSLASDLIRCQRWYQKSYSSGVSPGTVTNAGAIWNTTGKVPDVGGNNQRSSVFFPVEFAQAPAAMGSQGSNYYDVNGAVSRQSTIDASGTLTNNQNLSVGFVMGIKSMYVFTVVPQNVTSIGMHYTLDARPSA